MIFAHIFVLLDWKEEIIKDWKKEEIKEEKKFVKQI